MGVVINTSDNSRVDVQDGGAPAVNISQDSVGSVKLSSSSGTSVSFVSNTPSSVAVSGPQSVGVKLTTPSAQSAVINSSLSIAYVDTKWGDITGTVSNQTDLVNYITNRLPNVPYETANDILDALNSLSETDQLKVSVRPLLQRGLKFAEEENNSYTLPNYGNAELAASAGVSRYGWFLFSDIDGSLNWKQFPLDFISGFNEAAKVDGGDF